MSGPEVTDLVAQCRDPALKRRDLTDLQRLGKRVGKAIAGRQLPGPVTRITILSSFLSDFLAELLPAFLLRHNVVAEIRKGPYGGIATEILNPTAALISDTDLVMLLPTHRDLACYPAPGCSVDEADLAAARDAKVWTDLWDRVPAPIVQLSFDPPTARPLAEADGFLAGGKLRHVRRVNHALADAPPSRVALLDAEALAMRLGAAWHDPRLYQLCKQPFAPEALPEIADSLASAAAGLLGKARKVLVLDLDNTLWGGVVGDVGVEGITLGQETAEGEAFVALQTYTMALARRGVILAVCSKNQAEIAVEPFRSHPAMVLKEDDIACFVANFDDKATNLRRIAETLNVGLDSLVFVDDNPVERAWIARELPEVYVVNLPEDPSGFGAAIEDAKVFPLHRLTTEDVGRNRSYRARSETIVARNATGDLDSFLRNLNPVAIVEPVGPGSLDRIVQLVAKTNQFKLNPTTFSGEEVARNREGVLALRFKDKLQDYGITAIAVTEFEGDELVVRNWVMSCRVFSRRLEHATLEILRRRADVKGANQISLNYQPSAKNGLVRDVLVELGFTPQGENGRFVASIRPNESPIPHHIEIVHP